MIVLPHRLRAAPAGSPLEFIGRKLVTGNGSGSVDLTTLTDGLASSPLPGDLVVGFVASNSGSDETMTVGSGYTTIGAELFPNLEVAYKVMGGSPDSSISISGNGALVGGALVFRGQNSTVLDIAATTQTGVGTSTQANPDGQNVSTPGSIACFVGAGFATSAVAPFTSSDLPHFFAIDHTAGGRWVQLGVGFRLADSAVDPAAFGGGLVSGSASWAAVSFTIRPA